MGRSNPSHPSRPFVRVALVREVKPGRLLRVEVAGKLICLANVLGTIYAFDDDCTHISGPLDQGEIEGFVLTCPWHLARFDIRTGQVLRGPARADLPVYQVKIEGDAVLVEEPAPTETSSTETTSTETS
jgi:3-phenylpropionate/trans-cinnamate dioxygenase ferredoxin component